MTTSERTTVLNRTAALVALGVLAACGQGADTGDETADGLEGETASQPADTAVVPAPTDTDDPGLPAGLTEADEAGDTSAGSGEAGDTVVEGTLAALDPQLRVPGGTEVTLTADADITTDGYDVGDPVMATVVQDVVARDGTILIPRGVKFLGRVEASAGSGGVGELPILEMSFETLSAWSYERPIETLVTHAAVTIDPEADRARRDAMTVLPGRITAGSIIMVQLREPVFVPRDATMRLPGDSLAPEGLLDTVPDPDTIPRVDGSP